MLSKNRMISAKNRLSTSAQASTATTSATIPYSYLTLSRSLARTDADRDAWLLKNRMSDLNRRNLIFGSDM
jgi:hypothetical protein